MAAEPFVESAADRSEGRSPPGSAQVECVGLSATPGFLTSAMRVLLALLGGAPLVFVGFEVMRPHPAARAAQ